MDPTITPPPGLHRTPSATPEVSGQAKIALTGVDLQEPALNCLADLRAPSFLLSAVGDPTELDVAAFGTVKEMLICDAGCARERLRRATGRSTAPMDGYPAADPAIFRRQADLNLALADLVDPGARLRPIPLQAVRAMVTEAAQSEAGNEMLQLVHVANYIHLAYLASPRA